MATSDVSKKWQKIGCVVFKLCKQTDKQADTTGGAIGVK